MPEEYQQTPEQNQPFQEKEKVRELLPVSKEAVDISLKEIADNPEGAMREESALLMDEDKTVNNFFMLRAQSSDSPDYTLGVLWTHRILRKQAEVAGIEKPEIKGEDVMGYLQSEKNKVVSGERDKDWEKRFMAELAEEDPEMQRAIMEITKYQPNKSGFILGMSEIYGPHKRKLKTRQMPKWVVAE